MSDQQTKLRKIRAAIAAQKALRGLLPDEQLKTTLASLWQKEASLQAALLSGAGATAQGQGAIAAAATGDNSVAIGKAGRDIITGDNNSIRTIVNHYHRGGGKLPEEDYRAAAVEYLRWLRAGTRDIKLTGVKQGTISLPLEQIYVPLQAQAMPSAKEQLKRSLHASYPDTEGKKITMSALLQQGNRLAIIGGPGSGKTTVLGHIAWTLSEAILADNPAFARKRLGLPAGDPLPLPIYIPLNAFAEHRRRFRNDRDPRQSQLAAFIGRHLIKKEAALTLPQDFFAALIKKGERIILLLDGLDEAPNQAEREQVSEAILNLTQGRDETRFVVASRTQAYKGRGNHSPPY